MNTRYFVNTSTTFDISRPYLRLLVTAGGILHMWVQALLSNSIYKTSLSKVMWKEAPKWAAPGGPNQSSPLQGAMRRSCHLPHGRRKVLCLGLVSSSVLPSPGVKNLAASNSSLVRRTGKKYRYGPSSGSVEGSLGWTKPSNGRIKDSTDLKMQGRVFFHRTAAIVAG